jgi:tetratricopeptide (TPR) repeat protein
VQALKTVIIGNLCKSSRYQIPFYPAMKPDKIQEPAFLSIRSSWILCMLSVTNIPVSPLTHPSNFALTTAQRQIPVLAQLPGSHHSSNQQGNNQVEDQQSQLIQTANTLFEKGDLVGAQEVLRKFVKKFPESSDAHYYLGNILFREGLKEDAIKEYQIAINLNSQYALAHNAIGQVFASQQQWSLAIAEYRKALSINPQYGEALTNLAQPLWEQGFSQEARASLEKALKIFKEQDRPDKVKQVEQILQKIGNR